MLFVIIGLSLYVVTANLSIANWIEEVAQDRIHNRTGAEIVGWLQAVRKQRASAAIVS